VETNHARVLCHVEPQIQLNNTVTDDRLIKTYSEQLKLTIVTVNTVTEDKLERLVTDPKTLTFSCPGKMVSS